MSVVKFDGRSVYDRLAADLRVRVCDAMPEGYIVGFRQSSLEDPTPMFEMSVDENGVPLAMVETSVVIRIPMNVVRLKDGG